MDISVNLEDYSLTHSAMLAQYNTFYLVLLVFIAMSAAACAFTAPRHEDKIQASMLFFPVLPFLALKYVIWIYRGASNDTSFISLFSSADVHEVFRRALLLDTLTVSLIASICALKWAGKLQTSTFACMAGMLPINLVKMWLYELFASSSLLEGIGLFVQDSLGILAVLCMSGLWQLIIWLETKRTEELDSITLDQ